ncbi:MAG: TPM domain-containing protein [Spirochaetaceae bacterium]|jgi:uncharacterized protein|nr:TPM domain-containing protein [Spirochaetaceae bacterium]
MKRALLCAAFVLSCAVTAALDRVVDEAEALSTAERTALAHDIDTIIQEYKFDVAIVTQSNLGGKPAQDFADDYFDYNGYGIGESRDGILFLIAMEERTFHLSTSGYGMRVFTDYGLRRTIERMKSALQEGRYFEAFSTLLSDTVYYLDHARSGAPFDRGSADPESAPHSAGKETRLLLFVIALVALGIALAVAFALKSQLKSIHSQRSAQAYLKQGSFQVTGRSDQFLYSTTTKTARQTNNTGGGTGSTTHTGSSGRSHGGAGGKF